MMIHIPLVHTHRSFGSPGGRLAAGSEPAVPAHVDSSPASSPREGNPGLRVGHARRPAERVSALALSAARRSVPLLVAAGALVPGLSTPAQAQPVAKGATAITIHAGPASAYPEIRHLPVNSAFLIHGCLADFGWCDVGSGRFRGWVDARQLAVDFGGQIGPVVAFGPRLGVPVVNFAIGPYWSTHYRHQPWFNDPLYAPAIESWRMQSRAGNTVIEVERTWHARPQYVPVPVPPPMQYEYVPPAVIHHRPPPAYAPPPVHYRPAPGYVPVPPPSARPGWAYDAPPPDRGRPHFPPPQYHPPHYQNPQPAQQPDFNNLPGYQPGSRPMPPGAIIQHGPAEPGGGLGSRMLK